MPQESFRLHETPEKTLQAWKRKLEYLHNMPRGSESLLAGSVAGDRMASLIDDRDANITYTGTWNQVTNHFRYFNQTATYSTTIGDSLTLRFTGSYISFVTYTAPNRGTFNISIDGETTTVDLYTSAERYRYPSWEKTLDPGSHTLTLTISSNRNSTSTDYLCYVDAFQTMERINLSNLGLISVAGHFNVATNAAGHGTATVAAETDHIIVGMQVDLSTNNNPSPDSTGVKPDYGSYGNVVRVWDGPANSTVSVYVTALEAKTT